MVYLIAGPRNSGKTTRLLKLYNEKGGGGILSVKGKKNNKEFYKLVFLGNYLKDVLLATEDEALAKNPDFFKFKRFYFSKTAFKKATLYFNQLRTSYVSPLFLDEIGELEFNGMGFHDICLKLINLNRDVYLSVRNTYLTKFLSVFKPKRYEVLNK